MRNFTLLHNDVSIGGSLFLRHGVFRQEEFAVAVASVAGLRLRCVQLDVVRRSVLVRCQTVESRKCVFHVVVEQVWIRRYVADQNKIVRPIFGFQQVLGDFEIHPGRIHLVIRQPFGILAHMTTVAVLVRHGMANLTLDLSSVNAVDLHLRGLRSGIRMALFAGLVLANEVAVEGTAICGVHFVRTVAAVAVHVILDEMDVARVAFVLAQELLLDPTPVAGRAVRFHVRPFVEEVPVYKTTFHGIRPAHVALSATGMAALTVIREGHLYLGQNSVIAGVHSGVKISPVRLQGVVNAPRSNSRDFLVAISTGFVQVFEGGIFDDAFVRRFPVWIGGIAAVAVSAGNLAVGILFEIIAVDKDLFVRLQRSQLAASSFALCELGFAGLGMCFLDCAGDLDQFARACVARNTLTLILRMKRVRAGENEEDEK